MTNDDSRLPQFSFHSCITFPYMRRLSSESTFETIIPVLWSLFFTDNISRMLNFPLLNGISVIPLVIIDTYSNHISKYSGLVIKLSRMTVNKSKWQFNSSIIYCLSSIAIVKDSLALMWVNALQGSEVQSTWTQNIFFQGINFHTPEYF